MRTFTISTIILFIIAFTQPGCDIRKREQQLEKKAIELHQKEQELLLKEKTLQLKEEELLSKLKDYDSIENRISADTGMINPVLVGTWNVRMNCIETSCAGSAIGDVRTEQWNISYQNSNIIAQVISNNKLVRVYSGISTNNSIELNFNQTDSTKNETTNMVVRLQQTANGRLEGRREITRTPENCKIVFAMDLVKQ